MIRPSNLEPVSGSVRHDAKTPQVVIGEEEIFEAHLGGKHVAVVATGRSDFANQINNVLAFPGVFRGALDADARRITERMKVAAAEAIFSVASDDLAPDRIVPSPLDPRVGPAVASAVAAAAAEI